MNGNESEYYIADVNKDIAQLVKHKTWERVNHNDIPTGTGNRIRSNISGAEEIVGKLRRMRRDLGTIISKAAHGRPTWNMRPPDEGVWW